MKAIVLIDIPDNQVKGIEYPFRNMYGNVTLDYGDKVIYLNGEIKNAGNLEEAKAWLEGEKWNIEEIKTVSVSEETKEVLENILERIDKEVFDTLSESGDDWFTADKISKVKEIIEEYMEK